MMKKQSLFLLMFAIGIIFTGFAQTPPTNLVVTTDESLVTLNWEPVGNEWLSYYDDVNVASVGAPSGGNISMAVRWFPEDLTDYGGFYIKKLKFHFDILGTTTVVAKIWSGSNAQNILYEFELENPTDLSWNEIVLDTPIAIDINDELWVGYDFVNQPSGVWPGSIDGQPCVPDRGGMIYVGGAWTTLPTLGVTPGNWNIACYVSSSSKASKPSQSLGTTNKNSEEFEGYNVYRDDVMVNTELLNEETFSENLDDGVYTYNVTAIYDGVESDPSNYVDATVIANQINRDFVLVEDMTSTGCTYCPGAAMAIDDLIANGKQVAVLAHHLSWFGDVFYNDDTQGRANYYGTSGIPDAYFDGILNPGLGDANSSTYEVALPYYEGRINDKTSFNIALTGSEEGGVYNFVATTEKVASWFDNDNIKLRVAVTESEIQYNWLAGLTELQFVTRVMLPTYQGTLVNFENNNIQELSFDFTADDEWIVDNLEVVAFLQNDNTKEVLCSTKSSLDDLLSGINNLEVTDLKIYPNPTSKYCSIKFNKGFGHVKIVLINSLGKVIILNEANIDSKNDQTVLDMSNSPSGVYFLKIYGDNLLVTKKIIVQ